MEPDKKIVLRLQRDCSKNRPSSAGITNAVPMEIGLAFLPSAEGSRASRVAGVQRTPGLHTGVGAGRTEGRAEDLDSPDLVMAVAEANYGRLGETQAQRYIDGIAAQLGSRCREHCRGREQPEYDPFSDLENG
jgi:hypothetical protein